jgi:hypothetical protein
MKKRSSRGRERKQKQGKKKKQEYSISEASALSSSDDLVWNCHEPRPLLHATRGSIGKFRM